MIKGKLLTPNSPEVKKCFEIRHKVFIEEQNVPKEEEYDNWDNFAKFVAVYDNDEIVGTGRIFFDGDEYRIGRIAVLKEHRGKHYGDFIVRILIDNAFDNGAEEIHLGAQVRAVGFYEKIGFKVCGEEYIDANIPHLPMILKRQDFCTGCGHTVNYDEK